MEVSIKDISNIEPITITEAKTFLAVDHDMHNDLIAALIIAARERAEVYTDMSFVDREIEMKVEGWPSMLEGTDIYEQRLKSAPLKEIKTVKYIDSNNAEQTIPAENVEYNKKTRPSLVYMVGELPKLSDTVRMPVTYTYVVGFDNPSENQTSLNPFPETVRVAMKMMIRTMYDRREDFAVGVSISKMPVTSEHLLNDYRLQHV